MTPPQKLRDDLPAPGPDTIELAGPTFEVSPGASGFTCMRIPFDVEQDLYVNTTRIYQAEEGHHVLLLYRTSGGGAESEPHPCEAIDMTSVQFVTSGTGDGAGLSLPPGIALKIPRGVELWAQSHYTNSGAVPRQVQDVIQLDLIAADDVREVASVFAHVDVGFELPPGRTTTRSMSCELPRAATIPWLLPHMHENGTFFAVELTRGSDVLYAWSNEWMPAHRDTFAALQFSEPIAVQPGDVIRTTCTWRNEGDETLRWPAEMCVSFFPFYPGDGSLVTCDQDGFISGS